MYPAGTAELRTYAVLSAQFVILICAVEGELTLPMEAIMGIRSRCQAGVVILALVMVTVPVWVAITACPPSPLALIVTFDRVTLDPLPVAKAPLAPVPVVVIVPPVTVTCLAAVASRPALSPRNYCCRSMKRCRWS